MNFPCISCLTVNQIRQIARERNFQRKESFRKKELYEVLFGQIYFCSEHSRPGEIWKLVSGMSRYEISSLGRLRNIHTLNLLKGNQNPNGYVVYHMTNDQNVKKLRLAHRIVAQTFIDNPYNYEFVDHIDRNPNNNAVINLRWVTPKMNCSNRNKYKQLGGLTSIQQFDRSVNFIRTWKSITEAAEFYEISPSVICGVLRGRYSTAAGYKWKYTKDEIEGEIWKSIPIDGLKFVYLVSDRGRIFSPSTGKKTYGSLNQEYCRTGLTMIDGKRVSYQVHRLVMITFANDQNNDGLIVNHKDGNKSNNCLTNLEWVTHSGNRKHAVNLKLVPNSLFSTIETLIDKELIVSWENIKSTSGQNRLFKFVDINGYVYYADVCYDATTNQIYPPV